VKRRVEKKTRLSQIENKKADTALPRGVKKTPQK
jgi:hypothetical protein